MVHAVETNSAFDVFKAMLSGCSCNLVVLGGRNQIVGSGVENDVRWKRQVADRVVLAFVAKAAFIVLGVRWRWSSGDQLGWRQRAVPESNSVSVGSLCRLVSTYNF